MRNSMTQQRRFTKEFEEEAVRLVQTSGRTQREIAGDLGIGLSTLVRWIGRSRDRRARISAWRPLSRIHCGSYFDVRGNAIGEIAFRLTESLLTLTGLHGTPASHANSGRQARHC